jgi:hypothetical protein
MEETSMTVLLGEAPKTASGYAFDPDSFTTQQIAAAVGVDPRFINRRFWVMNVFDEQQESKGRGFNHFPMEEAVERLSRMWIPNRRIVCVGGRVAQALEEMLAIDSIPENRFSTFQPRTRKAEWELGYIVHPSSLRNSQRDPGELILSRKTQEFLRLAASLR